MKSHEYNGLDILKVFAAIGVVAIHTGTPVLNTLGRLGVPFFAIVSSFLFFKKYYQLKTDEQWDYLRHFLSRIGLLYLYWQVIYLPSAAIYLMQNLHRYGKTIGLKHFLAHFFFPPLPLTNGWGQSWYLIGMLIAMPLFLVLIRLLGRYLTGIICLLLCVFYVDYNTDYHFWNLIHYLPHGLETFLGPVGNNSFPILLIYIFIGMLITENISLIMTWPRFHLRWIVVGALALYMGENVILWCLMGRLDNEFIWLTVPTSLCLTLWGMRWNIKLQQTIFWRRFSTFLYCIHVGIIHIFDVVKIVLHTQFNSFLVFGVTLVISYLLYCLFIHLIQWDKFHWLRVLV